MCVCVRVRVHVCVRTHGDTVAHMPVPAKANGVTPAPCSLLCQSRSGHSRSRPSASAVGSGGLRFGPHQEEFDNKKLQGLFKLVMVVVHGVMVRLREES